MKITILSTKNVTNLDGVSCRVWEGITESGITCKVFVHRLAVALEENQTDFEKELSEQLEPSRTVDLWHFL